MRITIVTYSLNVGGVSTCCRQIADYLIEQGHDVLFVETSSKGNCSDGFARSGYCVMSITARPWESARAHALRIARNLWDCDAVLLNDAPLAQAGLGLLGPSVVVVPILHMDVPSMVATAVSNSPNWDVLSGICPHVAAAAQKCGLDRGKVACIPNGVTVPAKWPRLPEQFEQDARAIYVGRIEHSQKGVLYLPEVMVHIHEHVKMDLDIVGDGPDLKALQSAFRAKGLDEHCHFYGALSHEATLTLLAKAHMLLMPSHYEGLPLALLEAMAWGVVPIVSRLEGCTDYVLGGQSGGILVPPGDPAEMARAAVGLASSPGKLRLMSEVAWRTALERFSFQSTGEAYLRLIIECRSRKQTAGAQVRSGRLDETLLGDLPSVPGLFRRPVRKARRLCRRIRSLAWHE